MIAGRKQKPEPAPDTIFVSFAGYTGENVWLCVSLVIQDTPYWRYPPLLSGEIDLIHFFSDTEKKANWRTGATFLTHTFVANKEPEPLCVNICVRGPGGPVYSPRD